MGAKVGFPPHPCFYPIIYIHIYMTHTIMCGGRLRGETTKKKSAKSLAFTPNIGYFLNNGIIFSLMSLNFVTLNTTASLECL